METVTLAITGAAGRMGMRLVALSKLDPALKLVAAVDRPIGAHVDQDAGEVAGVGKMGLPLTIELAPTPNVLVDFTTPPATRHWLKTCRDRGIAMVIGTTGLSEADHETIDQAANTSLGVNLLLRLVADAARRLGDDYDIEIVEGHHRFKKDAPSGTAMAIANAILSATGKGKGALVFDRHGSDAERKRGEIGVHALRIGDEVGRHTTYFATLGERLEITHVATNRDTFALGALRAAKWLAGQKPGRYGMADVLGLKD
jgi:4-hydroxy-tetrahydrodipicolinate reductase